MEERGVIAWNAQNHVDVDDDVVNVDVDDVDDVDDVVVVDVETAVEAKADKTRPGLEVYDFPFGMELLKR